jgi:hypothetical protein
MIKIFELESILYLLVPEAGTFLKLRLFSKEVTRFLDCLILIDLGG